MYGRTGDLRTERTGAHGESLVLVFILLNLRFLGHLLALFS